jgi:peptidase E
VSADQPTILATSGGLKPGRRTRWELGGLSEFAIDLSGATGRAPRVCMLATAMGDNPMVLAAFYELAQQRGLQGSHLAAFPMPNVEDVTAHLLEQDVIWVFGGSVAGLLAMWRLHGFDDALRRAWQAGVVLTGVSAGSLCWHVGGTTDSFGPELRPVTNGLALVPFSNGVHYDSEEQRRPLFQALVADGSLPAGYATDDGAGLLYRGTEFAEAVAENDTAGAYWVERDSDGQASETELSVRRL